MKCETHLGDVDERVWVEFRREALSLVVEVVLNHEVGTQGRLFTLLDTIPAKPLVPLWTAAMCDGGNLSLNTTIKHVN